LKRVSVGVEPAVLSAFRAENPGGTWSEFKDFKESGTVFDSLAREQGFICAYCEMTIEPGIRGQVEHFEPKSRSTARHNLHLDFGNLLGCCEGGTWAFDPRRSEPPIPKTQHCGSLKGDRSPAGQMLDPRHIPLEARIWLVSSNTGQLSVDRAACLATGVDPNLATSTLDFVGLNRPVLARQRRETLAELDRAAFGDRDETDGEISRFEVAVEQILPDSRGRLPAYWSTIRIWAGPGIDSFIAANRNKIPGFRE
jgi:uncharacterized protein (TIGR02646 family)